MNPNSNAWALLVACGVLASCVFLNVDGYQLHLISPWGGVGEITGEPPLVNWCHGWPVGFAIRSSMYSVDAGRGVNVQSFTGDCGLYSRWPIDESPVIAFSVLAAVCDLLICMTLVCGTFVGARKLALHFGFRLRFGIRSLLVWVFVLAVVLTLRHWVFASRYVLEVIAFVVTTFGICMCLMAIPWRTGELDAPYESSPSIKAI